MRCANRTRTHFLRQILIRSKPAPKVPNLQLNLPPTWLLQERGDGAPDREEEHRAALDEFKEIMEEEMEVGRVKEM